MAPRSGGWVGGGGGGGGVWVVHLRRRRFWRLFWGSCGCWRKLCGLALANNSQRFFFFFLFFFDGIRMSFLALLALTGCYGECLSLLVVEAFS